MASTDQAAESFLTDLKALPKPVRDAVIVRIARDKQMGQDFLDLATIESRREEKTRPFREYLAEKQGN